MVNPYNSGKNSSKRFSKLKKKGQKATSSTAKKNVSKHTHTSTKPTQKKRRSFSQANLASRHSGENGPLLVEALTIPEQGKGGYAFTHGFHSYPGRFHPNLPQILLKNHVTHPNMRVFDPFMGGGTTLVEGMCHGCDVIGNDLNPIALLVAKERCRLRSPQESQDVFVLVKELEEKITQITKKKIIRRVNIHYLRPQFAPHLFVELLYWIDEIEKLPPSPIQDTLVAVFSGLVIKFSNKGSDISESKKRSSFPKGAVSKWMVLKTKELLDAQQVFYRKVPKKTNPPLFFSENITTFQAIPKDSVDLIITSPPYPGTFDYYEHHLLRMKWLKISDKELKQYEIGTKRRHSAKQWKQPFREILLHLRKIAKPGASCYLVLGDWLDRERPINALDYINKYAPSVGWDVSDSASIQRQIFVKEQQKNFGEQGKWEHLIHLKRPQKIQ